MQSNNEKTSDRLGSTYLAEAYPGSTDASCSAKVSGREPRNTGKWKRKDVPHTNWACVRMINNDDLDFPSSGFCEMCEVTHIAYAHVMHHPQYPHDLCCGVICAGYMTDNPEEALRRDITYKAWRELQKKPDTGTLRRRGWNQVVAPNGEHAFSPSRRTKVHPKLDRLLWDVRIREYEDTGWLGLIYYRCHLVAGAEPASDWRLAALNAMVMVEGLCADEAQLAKFERIQAEENAARKLRDWHQAVASLKREITDPELLAKIDQLPNDKPDYPAFREISWAWMVACTHPTHDQTGGLIHDQTT
jgi:hypothetical protein